MLFLRGSSAPVSQRPNTIALKDVLNIPKASSMYKSHKILERETSVFIHAKYFIQIFFLQFFVLLQIVIASGRFTSISIAQFAFLKISRHTNFLIPTHG